MATPGTKPTPTLIRLINGNHNTTRHGTVEELQARIAAADDFGPLVPPAGLSERAVLCWEEMIRPARWLDGSKMIAAAALCELYAEWQKGPHGFPGSKHAQMRAYMAELGLTDERKRIKTEKKQKNEFFDD